MTSPICSETDLICRDFAFFLGLARSLIRQGRFAPAFAWQVPSLMWRGGGRTLASRRGALLRQSAAFVRPALHSDAAAG